MIKGLFVVLHVITAAGWFGMALLLTSISRQVAGSADHGLREVGSKAVSMMTLFAVLTFIFGLIAFLAGGGFSFYGPLYHTSLLLVLVLAAVQYLMIRRGWVTLVGDGGAGAQGRKQLAMGIGVGHLIWLVVLVLMLWRHFAI